MPVPHELLTDQIHSIWYHTFNFKTCKWITGVCASVKFYFSCFYSLFYLSSLRLHFLIQHIYNIYTPSQYPFCIISKSCIHKLTSIKSQIETCNLPTLVIQLSSPPDYNLLQWFPSQGGLHNQLEIVLITGSDPGPSQSELLRMRFRNVHADITPLESPVISQVYLPLIWSTFF